LFIRASTISLEKDENVVITRTNKAFPDLEYIDLLQIHRSDPNTPFEETMCALKDIVQSGKVRCESRDLNAVTIRLPNPLAYRHWREQHVRLAIHGVPVHRQSPRLAAIHQHAKLLLRFVQGGGEGDDALYQKDGSL
jgi:hypothetical protein